MPCAIDNRGAALQLIKRLLFITEISGLQCFVLFKRKVACRIVPNEKKYMVADVRSTYLEKERYASKIVGSN